MEYYKNGKIIVSLYISYFINFLSPIAVHSYISTFFIFTIRNRVTRAYASHIEFE